MHLQWNSSCYQRKTNSNSKIVDTLYGDLNMSTLALFDTSRELEIVVKVIEVSHSALKYFE